MKKITAGDCVLVAIDYQEKLVPAMAAPEQLIDKTVRLVKGLKALEVPAIVTQQYTKGLGPTVESVAQALGDFTPIDKTSFSAMGDEAFVQAIEAARAAGRRTVFLMGIETHICVEQTALDLLAAGFDVYLIADCCQSRSEDNDRISKAYLAQAGVKVTSYESVLYTLLGSAKAPAFKAISAIVK